MSSDLRQHMAKGQSMSPRQCQVGCVGPRSVSLGRWAVVSGCAGSHMQEPAGAMHSLLALPGSHTPPVGCHDIYKPLYNSLSTTTATNIIIFTMNYDSFWTHTYIFMNKNLNHFNAWRKVMNRMSQTVYLMKPWYKSNKRCERIPNTTLGNTPVTQLVAAAALPQGSP